MQLFSYTYQRQAQDANLKHYTENGYNRYRITLLNSAKLTIAPVGIPGSSGMIWVQSYKPGEIVYPHDLIQALGDGIEDERFF
ncbi:MAG TPA: hypothetical protein VGG71_02585 [Chitinophagaceae bacterium]